MRSIVLSTIVVLLSLSLTAQYSRYRGAYHRPAGVYHAPVYHPRPAVTVHPVHPVVVAPRPVVVAPYPRVHVYVGPVYHPPIAYPGAAFVWHVPVGYWGPYWCPVGTVITTMAITAVVVHAADESYYYDQGTYYEEQDEGGKKSYKSVSAPIGVKVDSLPPHCDTLSLDSTTYYYYNGDFYESYKQKYKVVWAPEGIVVASLPDGSTALSIDDQTYYTFNKVYYKPISIQEQVAYKVVSKPKKEK